MEVYAYSAERYGGVEEDVAKEREGGRSAGAVAKQMSLWAGIHSADNLKWMLDEMGFESNREHFRRSQLKDALWQLLFALHARPMPGHPLLTVEEAIEKANDILDSQMPGGPR